MKFSSILHITSALLAASSVCAQSLKEAANGFRIGVAATAMKFNDAGYVDALSNFNYMVAENDCKMVGIQPQQGNYDFTACDNHYNKAIELGMEFRGHCLVWHSMPPQWFEQLKGDDLKTAMVDHINKVLTYYEGKIDTWDVVNEAIDDSSNGPDWIMRPSFLYQNIPDFVDLAFQTARQASPTTKLFYNDYNTEGVYGKTEAVFNFVKDMISRGIPIDGVGLQYHVSVSAYPEFDKINDLIGRYCDLGIELHITEMDVKSGGNSEQQAKVYADALKACLNNSCCTGFLVWGVDDTSSWLGANEAGLLFDGSYQKKPAYNALLEVLTSTTPAAGAGGAPVAAAPVAASPAADAPAADAPAADAPAADAPAADAPAATAPVASAPAGLTAPAGGLTVPAGGFTAPAGGAPAGGAPAGGGMNFGGGMPNFGGGGMPNFGGGGMPNFGGGGMPNFGGGGMPNFGGGGMPNFGGGMPNFGGGGMPNFGGFGMKKREETCAGIWEQCGGEGYTGPTCCSKGECKVIDEFFSQCQ